MASTDAATSAPHPPSSGVRIIEVSVFGAKVQAVVNKSRAIAERVVSSFGFSVFCFVVWGGMTAMRARGLAGHVSFMEVVWLVYGAALAVLFLVRTRPAVVDLNPGHWLVALLTSFSGLFFETRSNGIAGLTPACDALILVGLALSAASAMSLNRNYDFLPALRGVSTGWLYRLVRHPMYLASMIIRLGYLGRHASLQNLALFVIMVGLYSVRAGIEESIMRNDERYVDYARRVRYRFVPGVY